jgi:6-phosphofructokinase 2
MRPILTLTMNPAVDICVSVDRIEPQHKLRCGVPRRDPGGGGINVARVARRLGADPLAIYPAGGPTGTLLDRALSAEGVRRILAPIAGDTREDFTVDERSTGRQYRFVLPGPELTSGEFAACLAALEKHLVGDGFVVASGSLPPGAPADFYAQVGRLCAAAGARLALDCAGPLLRRALGGLFLIKPSLREFSELVGGEPRGLAACRAAAQQLIASGGAEFVALTLGADGALLAGKTGAWFAAAPAVTAASTVGAGDSFLAALVVSLARNEPEEEALALAVAAGSAALLSPGTGLCSAENLNALRPMVRVERLGQNERGT